MFLSSSVLTSAVLALRAAVGSELPPTSLQTVKAEAKGDHPVNLPTIPAVPAGPVAPKTLATKTEDPPMAVPVRPSPEVLAACAPAAASAPAFEIDPRYTLRRDFGDGIGYTSGFTYLEAFVPVWQTPGQSLGFLNARVVNFDAANYWETQIGGGYRQRADDVILGINGFYDGRNTDVAYFHQLGFGFEVLLEKWEFRSNFYIPIGDQRVLAGDSGFTNPQFVGTNIALDRQFAYQTAMRGYDLEAGRLLPGCWDALRTYAYLGFYHYDGAGVSSIDGVRTRLESWWNENFSANLSYQYDRVNNSTFTGGLSLHFGGVGRGNRQIDPLGAKLGNRVVRDPNIVTQGSTETKTELAIDPATGKPIEVRHASSGAAAGGNGSVERPFQTLAQLQTGSATNQILFAHAGSVFNNQSILLKANQRFLGEWIDHSFTATQGAFLLPRATAGGAAPQLSGIGLITLNNNTEVAGFNMTRAAAAITGTNFNNILIDRNRIVATTPGLSPISLFSTSAGARNWTITNNTFNSNLSITEFNGTVAARIRNNTFLTGGNLTILQTGGTSRYQIASNTFSGNGVLFGQVLAAGTSTTQFANNQRLAGTGIYSFTRATGTLNVENSLPSNTPAPVMIGTTSVPPGSAGFGNP